MGLDVCVYRIPKRILNDNGTISLKYPEYYALESDFMDKRMIGYWRKEYEVVYTAFGGWPKDDEIYKDITPRLGKLTKYLLFADKSDAYWERKWFDKFNTSDVTFIIKAWWYRLLGYRIFMLASY